MIDSSAALVKGGGLLTLRAAASPANAFANGLKFRGGLKVSGPAQCPLGRDKRIEVEDRVPPLSEVQPDSAVQNLIESSDAGDLGEKVNLTQVRFERETSESAPGCPILGDWRPAGLHPPSRAECEHHGVNALDLSVIKSGAQIEVFRHHGRAVRHAGHSSDDHKLNAGRVKPAEDVEDRSHSARFRRDEEGGTASRARS